MTHPWAPSRCTRRCLHHVVARRDLLGLALLLLSTLGATKIPTARGDERLASPGRLRHVVVYSEPGRFGGWPANHGIWSWGNEILVGFSRGTFRDLGPERHAIDRDAPEEHLLARSLDGGETWSLEFPAQEGSLIPVGKSLHGKTPPGLTERPWSDSPGSLPFTHPDFAMTLRMTDVHLGPSRFYYSTDRGHHWLGPFRIPQLESHGVAARTDYLVLDAQTCLLFLTASKANQREGRPFLSRTDDGGRTWQFTSWIGEEPAGYAIMPSTTRLKNGDLLTAIRCREGDRSWIALYRSTDLGATWREAGIPAPDLGEGNPASLITLADGRVCLTYGHRAPPYGIHARLADERGEHWGPELLLREAGGRDIGYPRSVQRSDGQIVTIYYLHDQPKSDRYIGATIWE